MGKSEKEVERLRRLQEQLIAVGVSEEVISYLLSKRPSKVLSSIHDFLVLFVMIIGFGVGVLLWGIESAFSERAALEHAYQTDGLLYQDIMGFSLLVAIFGWIFASGYISSSPRLVSSRMIASAFSHSITRTDKYGRPWHKAYSKIDKTQEPEDVVREVFSRQGAWAKWPAILLLFLVCPPLLDLELKAHEIFARDGVIKRSYLLTGDWNKTLWNDAIFVELGCNHITGKNPSDDPVYKVTFMDGHSERLENAKPVTGEWLDQIEIIDGVLAEAGVEFRRWQWGDRNPLHPECLAANRSKMSAGDYGRLLKLLRVD